VINGDCKVNIANIGQLNLHGTDDYSYDQLIEVVQLPSKMLRRK
jgi:hypothetical protein